MGVNLRNNFWWFLKEGRGGGIIKGFKGRLADHNEKVKWLEFEGLFATFVFLKGVGNLFGVLLLH